MNRTGIETADLSWDPVMLDRLHEPLDRRKPAIVAACWKADLFGDWVEAQHIKLVLAIAAASPHLTFQFLTKNPRRLPEFSPYPANCWVGASVPRQSADEREHRCLWQSVLDYFPKVKATVRFISFEPLLGPIALPKKLEGRRPHGLPFEWAIVGGLSGERIKHSTVLTKRQSRAYNLSRALAARCIPHYVKANLAMPCLPRQWPHGFTPPMRRATR